MLEMLPIRDEGTSRRRVPSKGTTTRSEFMTAFIADQ
jgi:hypothetical protein